MSSEDELIVSALASGGASSSEAKPVFYTGPVVEINYVLPMLHREWIISGGGHENITGTPSNNLSNTIRASNDSRALTPSIHSRNRTYAPYAGASSESRRVNIQSRLDYEAVRGPVCAGTPVGKKLNRHPIYKTEYREKKWSCWGINSGGHPDISKSFGDRRPMYYVSPGEYKDNWFHWLGNCPTLYIDKSTIPGADIGLFTAGKIESSTKPFLYYTGEILNEEQIRRRYGLTDEQNIDDNDGQYLVALNQGWFIDASDPWLSGAARLINHQMKTMANCRVTKNGGIIAIKNIPAFSELTYCYSNRWTRFFREQSSSSTSSSSSASSAVAPTVSSFKKQRSSNDGPL